MMMMMQEPNSAQGVDASELLSYPCTIEFLVPRPCVLSIFDPENKFVREIFALTGCTVDLQEVVDTAAMALGQPQVPSVDVKIILSGPLSGIQAAHIVITREVAVRLYGS